MPYSIRQIMDVVGPYTTEAARIDFIKALLEHAINSLDRQLDRAQDWQARPADAAVPLPWNTEPEQPVFDVDFS
jgi:hypothetical protein